MSENQKSTFFSQRVPELFQKAATVTEEPKSLQQKYDNIHNILLAPNQFVFYLLSYEVNNDITQIEFHEWFCQLNIRLQSTSELLK